MKGPGRGPVPAAGCHRPGLYLQLASALDGRILEVETVDGIGSYADWVKSRYYDEYDVMGLVFPGILQHLDLPDLKTGNK